MTVARSSVQLAPLLLLLALGACEDGSDTPSTASRRAASGAVVAQEVWIPYHDASHQAQGLFVPPPKRMTRELARRYAEAARAEAARGVDVGYLASRYGRTPWSPLGGFTGVLPAFPNHPDARDQAVAGLRVGDLSPIYEWHKGFGFAQRVSERQADRLRRRVRSANTVRARARVIHIHHAGAQPARYEFDKFTRAQAVAKARSLIKQIEDGADFAALARKDSNAVSTRRTGGLLVSKGDEWVRWRSTDWHYLLYQAILEDAPVGRVMPEPVISPMGVDVVQVLERKTR